MLRLLGLVLALVAAVACGKSRLRDDGAGGGGWDEPTAANGFHGDADHACTRACVPKGVRTKHAVRTSPEPRVIATLEEPSRVGLVSWHPSCLEGASARDWESGWWWCLDPRDGKRVSLGDHAPPSAMTKTATGIYLATRDVNGRSTIQSGKTILVAGESDVRALAARENEVCWIDANERVRCLQDGGGGAWRQDRESVRTVAHAPGIDARFLAMDEEAFYVVRGGTIARLVRDGDRLETLARAASPVHDLAVANGDVYWTEEGESRVECQADGNAPSCTARGRTVRHPFGEVRRVRIADRKATTLASDLEDAGGLVVAKEHVYVSTAQGLVRVAAKGDAPSPTVLPTGDPAIGRPALDPVSWTVYVQARRKVDRIDVVAIQP